MDWIAALLRFLAKWIAGDLVAGSPQRARVSLRGPRRDVRATVRWTSGRHSEWMTFLPAMDRFGGPPDRRGCSPCCRMAFPGRRRRPEKAVLREAAKTRRVGMRISPVLRVSSQPSLARSALRPVRAGRRSKPYAIGAPSLADVMPAGNLPA